MSLLLPLAGALYLRWSENAGPTSGGGRDKVFEPREAGEVKVTPARAVAAPVPPSPRSAAGAPSSLDYVKAGSDWKAPPAKKPFLQPAVAAPKQKPPKTAPAKKAAKKTSRSRLKPARGFSSFKGASPSQSEGRNPLQDLPPEARDNPEVQKLLQQQGL